MIVQFLVQFKIRICAIFRLTQVRTIAQASPSHYAARSKQNSKQQQRQKQTKDREDEPAGDGEEKENCPNDVSTI